MTNETGRTEAFSDGIFSIAATLLVLDLKAPAASMPFWQGIAAQWPAYASFLLSFLFIGIMWLNHHRLFSHVRCSSDLLMVTNLLLLLGVVWIPYPTSLMAQAVFTGQLKDAAILYNGSYLVIAFLFNLLFGVCVRGRLLDRNVSGVRNIARSYAAGVLMYVLCFAVTWWNVPVSLAINFGMAMFFLLSPDQMARNCTRHQSSGHEPIESVGSSSGLG
jgi:uncharacterized membrane protein